MFRKVLSMLLGMLLIASGVQAAEVEPVQSGIPVDTTGGQMTLYRVQMENGQELYCMGREAEGLWHKMEDVNFDGHDDFVTFPVMGARNAFAEFYVYQPQSDRYEYAPVWNGQLCNYELDAENQRVISYVADGMRDREEWIFTWKDGHLEPLRRLSIADVETFESTDSGYVITHDYNSYEAVIRDYTKNVNGEIIYEQVYPADETGEQDSKRIAAAREALMNGL